MMGGKSSKNSSGGVSLFPFSVDVDADVRSSYEAECENNPNLKSFDEKVHERTNRALNALSTGIGPGSMSLDVLIEIPGFLREMNEFAVKMILDGKEDVWCNKETFKVVNEFFDNSLETLKFCEALENCLRRTRNSRLIVKVAIAQFETAETGDEERYAKTIGELKEFQDAGNPFGQEFVQLFVPLYQQHLSLFEKLQRLKKIHDKKYRTMKTWKKVSNVILVTLFASVLVFSVVAAAMSAPPVVIALGAALAVPMGPVGKWCNTLWNRYLSRNKEDQKIINSMQAHSYLVLRDFENIQVLVKKLSIQLGSLLQNANLGIREQGAMQIIIDEIKKSLEGFDETLEKLSVHAAKCSTDVTKAREVIIQKIVAHPNR